MPEKISTNGALMRKMVCFLGTVVAVLVFVAAPVFGDPISGGFQGGRHPGADPEFAFSFTSNDSTVFAGGTLQAYSNGDGTYTATTGSVLVAGAAPVIGPGPLYPNPSPTGEVYSPSGFFIYDNQLLPGQNPLITNGGLLFYLGTTEVNIYSNGPGPSTYTLYENNGFNINGNFALTQVSAVPEPASLIGLSGLVAMGLIGLVWRRRK